MVTEPKAPKFPCVSLQWVLGVSLSSQRGAAVPRVLSLPWLRDSSHQECCIHHSIPQAAHTPLDPYTTTFVP